MAMTAKDKRMAAMKRRFDKTQPSNRTGQSFMQRIKNDMFGDKKGMGVDDDATKTDKSADKYRKNPPKVGTVTKKVDAFKKAGGPPQRKGTVTKKVVADKKNKKITSTVKKDNTTTKSKVKATAANTKNFASTIAMQKKLIKMGANIKADGIMGPKTRAAMAKYMKAPVPKSRPTKNSGVSQGSTIAKDRGKTGFGTSAMSTKGSTKPAEKRYKKSGITKLTELQKKRALRDNRRKVIGST